MNPGFAARFAPPPRELVDLLADVFRAVDFDADFRTVDFAADFRAAVFAAGFAAVFLAAGFLVAILSPWGTELGFIVCPRSLPRQ
jgi:hypothetical protein